MGGNLAALNSISVNQFLTRGIVGFYTPESVNRNTRNDLDGMLAALDSSLHPTRVEEAGYGCAGTDSHYASGDGLHVLLAGHPNFTTSNLAKLAAQEGSAAALASTYAGSNTDFLTQIAGDFSFCIIDAKNDRVTVGIDRFGQHPLYYRQFDRGIAWGTTANSVLAQNDCAGKLTDQGIYNYVYFHMVPCPDAIFEGLKKLPAAHYLRYENGQTTIVRYWQPRFRRDASRSFRELCRELRPSLQAAVKRAIQGEKNVGAFLSGGLDSSTVAGVLAEVGDSEANAFSIGFAAEGYDEMPYARLAARHFGIKLHEYYVTPEDVVEALPLIAQSYDEPFGNSSALPAYFCARFAAEHGVNRLLAGDGGDEIFAGNERYERQRVFNRYLLAPAPIRRYLMEPMLRNMPDKLPLLSKARSYIEQANTPLPDRLQSYNFLHRNAPQEVFTKEFLGDVRTQMPLEIQQNIYNTPSEADQLDRMLYLDWQLTLADNDLRKVSHMCSLAGVDVVYPMLDDELVALSCEIPSRWKLKGHELRHFYKEALTGWLPQETITKSKKGFGLPFGVWMREHKPLQEIAYDNVINLKSRAIFKVDFLDQAIEMHKSGHAAYYGELIWILCIFELWMQKRNAAPAQ